MPVYLACSGRAGRNMTKEYNGAEVSWTLCGAGEEKLLLLHGWGCDGTLMQPVAERMQDRFRIMIPDFPGHGKSGRPPEPWGVPEYAGCLMQLLQDSDFAPCHVIAHSFGCRVAAWLAAEHPELFGKIIFTGAAGIRKTPSAEARKRSERYKKLKGICEQMKKMPLLNGPAGKWENLLRQKYGSPDYNALDDEMRKTFVKVINQDLTELYGKFRASTLLIWGDADTETPLWMGKEMEKRIPDAGLVTFEGGTHFAYLEQIDRFATIARQFLKEDE